MVQPGATAQQFLNPIERRVELIQQEFDSLKKELQGVLVDIRVVLMRATAPFPDADATKEAE